jgi:hypothetical protein
MYLVLLVTWFDVWKYVLQGNQEYGHVVALQTYVLHTLGVRMVLQSLVVDLSTLLRNDLGMFPACELGLPCKVENLIQNRPFLAEIETA